MKNMKMYSRMSIQNYRDAPCTDIQFTCCPQYVYSSVEELAKLLPESTLKDLVWCRTVGLLHSLHGLIYVSNISSTGGIASDQIQVSFAHWDLPQSTVMPCPVQIFGSIQWHCRQPVLYVKLMQVLTVPKALQMKDIMDRLIDFKCHSHLKVTS